MESSRFSKNGRSTRACRWLVCDSPNERATTRRGRSERNHELSFRVGESERGGVRRGRQRDARAARGGDVEKRRALLRETRSRGGRVGRARGHRHHRARLAREKRHQEVQPGGKRQHDRGLANGGVATPSSEVFRPRRRANTLLSQQLEQAVPRESHACASARASRRARSSRRVLEEGVRERARRRGGGGGVPVLPRTQALQGRAERRTGARLRFRGSDAFARGHGVDGRGRVSPRARG